MSAEQFSRLESKKREQTPQALARLVVILVFMALWLTLWLFHIPMPVPFLLVLIAEVAFFLIYWRAVSFLPSVRAVSLAQYFMLAAEIGFHTTMVYFLGGISWLGAFAYVFGLIFTNTFLDLRRGMIYTTGASLAFCSLILLEATGTIPHYVYLEEGPLRHTDPRVVTTTLIGACGVFFSIYAWVNWVGHQLRQERDTAVRTQEELLSARGELQLANDELEQRVDARTSELERTNDALRESQEHLTAVISNAPVILLSLNTDGVITLLEGKAFEGLGVERESVIGRSIFDVYRSEPEVLESMRRALAGEATTISSRTGNVWFETRLAPVRDEEGRVSGVIGVATDVTERKQAETLLAEQKRLLEMITMGKPLLEVLEATVLVIEQQSPGTLCSVCLVDEEASLLRTAAAPSLPKPFVDALAAGIPIGPSSGSCGTAAHRGETVVVQDIAEDPLWADFAELALSHNLRACWSTPIVSTSGAVLGTFAMYRREPSSPSPEQRRLVEVAARIASIAIERQRADDEILGLARFPSENPNPVLRVTSDGTISYANEASHALLRTWGREVGERLPEFWRQHITEALAEATSREVESNFGGRTFSVMLAPAEGGSYVNLYARDVTDRQRAKLALEESETKFRILADTVAAAAFILQGSRMLYVNPAAERMTGYTKQELLSMDFWEVVHPDHRDAVKQGGLARQRDGRMDEPFEIKLVSKDGEVIWVDLTGGLIEFEGRPAILGTAFDITERKRVEAALKEAASRDSLTGLLNRRAGLAAIEERLEAAKSGGGPLALLVVDLDNFKKINDSFSHETGDAALLRFAEVLTSAGGEDAITTRLGGDEFEIALAGAGLAEASALAERVRSALRQALVRPGEVPVPPFTVSIGIACYPEDGESIRTLSRRADQAMYAAKANGGDRHDAWRHLQSEAA